MTIGQLTIHNCTFYTAHFDFTTARIVINCTLKYALYSATRITSAPDPGQCRRFQVLVELIKTIQEKGLQGTEVASSSYPCSAYPYSFQFMERRTCQSVTLECT